MITGPRKLVKRAKFCAKLFNINPTIEIKWTDDEHFSECVNFEDGTYRFLIQKWLHKDQLIQIIGHEMAHVWQYERGSLQSVDATETYIWEGKLYKHTECMEEYLLRPWEMEARALEDYCEWKWSNR